MSSHLALGGKHATFIEIGAHSERVTFGDTQIWGIALIQSECEKLGQL